MKSYEIFFNNLFYIFDGDKHRALEHFSFFKFSFELIRALK